jgi:hypothetical protein
MDPYKLNLARNKQLLPLMKTLTNNPGTLTAEQLTYAVRVLATMVDELTEVAPTPPTEADRRAGRTARLDEEHEAAKLRQKVDAGPKG